MMEMPSHKLLEQMFLDHYKEWCLKSFSYVENMDDAQDVVQNVFVKLLQKENLSHVIDIHKYLNVAIRNESLKKIKKSRETFQLNNQSTEVPSHESELIKGEVSENMLRELEALPEQNKRVFTLCVLEGNKYESAAEIMGITVNTVKYHLKKSFKSLRVNLKDVYLWFL
ncbi:RNA polymerase sigma factor [Maribacter flavus]|uniref:Sigma-70 family RNA polymerase sigma factor n=1 Tax=Maribacter flavus TaxID=1658664 RepID=A0A5B2TYE9_9FLAO|nr:sigma-70 family RNA polymerase sigma factor [Maribacter flavus]KAA2218865.1 sigma-70 family RNA polymerase sigma factor [Maribacter flavus]